MRMMKECVQKEFRRFSLRYSHPSLGDDERHHLVEAPIIVGGDEPEPMGLVVVDQLVVTDDFASHDPSGLVELLEGHIQQVAPETLRCIRGTGELSDQVRLDDVRPGVDVHALPGLTAQEVLVRDPHALDADRDVPKDPDIVFGDGKVRPREVSDLHVDGFFLQKCLRGGVMHGPERSQNFRCPFGPVDLESLGE